MLKVLKRKEAMRIGADRKRCRLPITPKSLLGLQKCYWERSPNEFALIMLWAMMIRWILIGGE